MLCVLGTSWVIVGFAQAPIRSLRVVCEECIKKKATYLHRR